MLIDKDKQEFLDRCIIILDTKGIPSESLIILGKTCIGKLYEDSLIRIIKSDDDQYMEMYRKSTESVFFYLFEGVCILFHGEYVYLEQHIVNILN